MESIKLTAAKLKHLERNLDSLSVGQLETDVAWLNLRAEQLKSLIDHPGAADASGLLERIDELISEIQSELATDRRQTERTALSAQGLEDPEADEEND